MIVARLTKSGQFLFHGSGEVTGSPAGDDYRMGGWFPVENFDFGFNEVQNESAPAVASSRTVAPPPASKSPATTTAGASKGGNDFKLRMTKQIDRATCNLMVLAMEERSQKKGENKGSDYHADIHVVGTVGFKDSANVERFVYPSLMVHLEGVHVVEWRVNGSGDQRPSESLCLEYDRVAIHYIWTGDGKEFLFYGPKGWDQSKVRPWPDDEKLPEIVFEKFLPKYK